MRPRDIVCSGKMGAIAPIRTANVHFSREFRAHAPPGRFLRSKFSEVQSSAFRMQMPGFHFEHVMLKYLRKKLPDKSGGGQGTLGPLDARGS